MISPSATAINLLPGGAGISIPEWEEEAPLVGETRFPKYELILVYPGIGQTKPLGLKSMISESIVFEFDKELELRTGIKKIEISNKNINKIRNEILKYLKIKSPHIKSFIK